MNTKSPKELAAGYLALFRGQPEPDDAFADVLETCGDLERGVNVTLALIEEARTDNELFYVAAGPVEDMLRWHGLQVVPAFDTACEHSEKLRRALTGVWLGEDSAGYTAWKQLVDKWCPSHAH